jgi:hypothetical protein
VELSRLSVYQIAPRRPSDLQEGVLVCPVCFNVKQLGKGALVPNAELAGSVQLWEWIGDDGATTFSY